MPTIHRLLIATSALTLSAGLFLTLPALADTALEQLQGVAEESEEAAQAPTPEAAKEEAGEGIDTPSNDAPPVDLRHCEPNCTVNPCDLNPELEGCKDQGGPIE